MFASRFNQAKCETTCRLCVGRIKLLRNKKTVQMKQLQKEIAELLRNGKQEYARIRVEAVIRERLLMQAYEILELYLELLTVRTQLIAKTKELPRDMMEAVSSIIYAAQRINDLPELGTLRTLFASKYGKEYANEAGMDAHTAKWQVNGNLIRCLLVEPPMPEDKLATLSEIAQEHGVEWDAAAAARDLGVGMGGGVGMGAHGFAGLPSVGPAAIAGSAAGPYPGHPGAMHPAPQAPVPPPPPPPQQPAVTHAQYANAQQAAHAAALAAAQAHAAAEYAAQVAAAGGAAPLPAPPPQGHRGNPNGGAPPPGWLTQHPPPSASSAPLPSPPASVLSSGSELPHFAPGPSGGAGPAVPAPPPPLSAEHPDGLPPPQSSGFPGGGGEAPPGSGFGGGGGYVMRSNEEIQRAYDAMPGPPSKAASAAPSAPPPLDGPPAAAPPAVPPPPPEVEDEYEELTRRLEALKRS